MGFLFSVLALFSVGEVRNYFIKNITLFSGKKAIYTPEYYNTL